MGRIGDVIPHFVILFIFIGEFQAQGLGKPSRSVKGPGVITTRQAIMPAGVQSVFEGRVMG